MNDMRSFIRELEQRGDLKRIAHAVSAKLEIADIADRMVKSGGPALLFENVKETPDVPVAIGLYGSDSRVALALHDSPQAIAKRIEGLIKTVPPEGLLGKMQLGLKLLPTGMSLGIKSVKDGPVKEVKYLGDDVDLSKLLECRDPVCQITGVGMLESHRIGIFRICHILPYAFQILGKLDSRHIDDGRSDMMRLLQHSVEQP